MQYAVIVAGGKGLRMGADLPKQFIVVQNYPVLYYTLQSFYTFNSSIHIILVLPKEHQSYWKECLIKHAISIPHQIVDGGETRFQSVKNGLAYVPMGVYVAIHDGVRPLVSKELIHRCFTACEQFESAIPVISVSDSLRKIEKDHSKAIDRSEYRMVQTPQCFKSEFIKKAYEQTTFNESLTDDAVIAETFGYTMHLVEGEKKNIKLTTPEDIILFNAFLA